MNGRRQHELRFLFQILLPLLCLSVTGPGAKATDEDRIKAFAWFDALGYPDVSKLQFAKIYTGEWSPTYGNRRIPSFEYGFITLSNATHFSSCRLALWIDNRTITPRTSGKEPVYYMTADLREYASERIKLRQQAIGSVFPTDLSLPVELFVLARACQGHGMMDLSAILFKLADNEMRQPRLYRPADHENRQPRDDRFERDFIDRMADEFARYELWRMVLEFEDPSITRESLLHQFELFNQHFQHTKYSDLADETLRELTRMVPEDRDSAARQKAQPGGNSQGHDIADLVFRLRDQNGQQYSQPGACDIFADARGEKSPASQLVRIGLPAVPALIAEITDSRLTRCVSYWRDYVFSHQILHIGDVATEILAKIAQRNFYVGVNSQRERPWREVSADLQAAAQKWWSQVQSSGERHVLAAAASTGDEGSVGPATRLVAHYPGSALPALLKGLDRTKSSEVRQGLVKLVGNMRGPEVVSALKYELHHGFDLGSRVEAAEALNRRGDPVAVRCMIREWKYDKDVGDIVDPLTSFLVHCGSPEAIQALGYKLHGRWIGARMGVVRALQDDDAAWPGRTPHGVGLIRISSSCQMARAAAAQRVLVSLLDDKDSCEGGTTIGDVFADSPRICDAAQRALAYLWPRIYWFHETSSTYERSRELVVTANRWRTDNGLSPIRLPSHPGIRPVSEQRIHPLIDQLELARTEQERQAVCNRIMSIGLPALPAVQAVVNSPFNESYRTGMHSLAIQISCIIRTARIAKNGVVPSSHLINRVADRKGKQLTSTLCAELILEVMNTRPGGAAGTLFTAVRDNDGTGFAVLVTLLPSRPAHLHSTTVRLSDNIAVGSYRAMESGGEAALVKSFSITDFTDVRKALHQAFSYDAYSPISIAISREFVPDEK